MEPFIGQIQLFGFNFAPRGWAMCSGQLLSIAQYTALFSLLGTTYGGDGRTTFGLPDLRGRYPMHLGQGPGLTNRNIGQRSGTQTNTLTQNQLPSHDHSVAIGVSTSTGEESAATGVIANHAGGFNEDPISGASLGGLTQSNVGGNQAINNLSPYLVVNICIALTGIFPSRN